MFPSSGIAAELQGKQEATRGGAGMSAGAAAIAATIDLNAIAPTNTRLIAR